MGPEWRRLDGHSVFQTLQNRREIGICAEAFGIKDIATKRTAV